MARVILGLSRASNVPSWEFAHLTMGVAEYQNVCGEIRDAWAKSDQRGMCRLPASVFVLHTPLQNRRMGVLSKIGNHEIAFLDLCKNALVDIVEVF